MREPQNNDFIFLLENILRAPPKKISKKNQKFTPADFVKHRLRIPKMYPACLSDVCEDGNYFLKVTRAQLKSHILALALSGSIQYYS